MTLADGLSFSVRRICESGHFCLFVRAGIERRNEVRRVLKSGIFWSMWTSLSHAYIPHVSHFIVFCGLVDTFCLCCNLFVGMRWVRFVSAFPFGVFTLPIVIWLEAARLYNTYSFMIEQQ